MVSENDSSEKSRDQVLSEVALQVHLSILDHVEAQLVEVRRSLRGDITYELLKEEERLGGLRLNERAIGTDRWVRVLSTLDLSILSA